MQNSHPIVNFLFFISVLVYGMLFWHPVLLGIAFLASLAYSLFLRGKNTAKVTAAFLFPTLLFVTLINTLFAHYGVTVLYVLPGGNRITLEALLYGLAAGCMVVTVFLWFSCYNAVVTTDKFLYLFGKRLPTAALLVSMTLRFIPLFAKRLRKIEQAQKGIGNGDGNRLKSAARSLSILVTWSLENAVAVADSMKGRGYGLRGRTNYSRYTFTKRDTGTTVGILLLNGIIIAGIILKQTKAIYNPYILLPKVSAFGVCVIIAYGALCFLPLIMDGTEVFKWHNLK